ncbi:hypothetical protein AVEN_27737-1 [Araneus ventricosus]|uniref:Uncharacterized protein n=1 Tax=Araneus ventricosus TaxID=182803 RepID=A0A4Y2TRX2_ARAVE|nr:hypothetical protein AVEN_27737-1 [Araneus ventricosus]
MRSAAVDTFWRLLARADVIPSTTEANIVLIACACSECIHKALIAVSRSVYKGLDALSDKPEFYSFWYRSTENGDRTGEMTLLEFSFTKRLNSTTKQ